MKYSEAARIETGTENGGFNISFYDGMPSSVMSNSNYMIKLMCICKELEITNEKIVEIFDIFNLLNNNYNTSEPEALAVMDKAIWKYYKLTKEVIHDIRYTGDMLIMLTSYANPNKPRIGKISAYAKKGGKELGGCYDEYIKFFKIISMLDNANKHHFTSDLLKEMCFEEPHICCIYCCDNWDFSDFEIINIPLFDIISQFNDFYKDFLKTIKSY